MRKINLLKNKKAAEMTIGTIIIIILALVVLIFLIYSFTKSGGNLMDNIRNFFGGGANVDTIKSSCSVACQTSQSYEYCGKIRTLNLDDKQSFKGSCDTLRLGVLSAGIETCPAVECSIYMLKTCETTLGGTWADKKTGCPTGTSDLTSSVEDSSGKDIKSQVCCSGARTCRATGSTCEALTTIATCNRNSDICRWDTSVTPSCIVKSAIQTCESLGVDKCSNNPDVCSLQ